MTRFDSVVDRFMSSLLYIATRSREIDSWRPRIRRAFLITLPISVGPYLIINMVLGTIVNLFALIDTLIYAITTGRRT